MKGAGKTLDLTPSEIRSHCGVSSMDHVMSLAVYVRCDSCIVKRLGVGNRGSYKTIERSYNNQSERDVAGHARTIVMEMKNGSILI